MLRRLITFLLCFTMACDAGLLTTPDADDIGALETQVGALPSSAKETLKYIEFRRAVEETVEDEPNMTVGHVACEGKPDVPVPLKALLAFMNAYETGASGPKSVDEMMTRFNAALSEHGCMFIPGRGTNVQWVKPERNDKSNRHLAELVLTLTAIELSRFESLAGTLGLAIGAGGVWYAIPGVAIGLTLCVLSDSIGCPDDPGAPGVPQPAPNGGDQ